MRTRLRNFRYTRPFWGGLYVLLAGLIITWLPLGPVNDIVAAGIGGFAGVLLGAVLIAMGVVILVIPKAHHLAAIVAIVLGLASYPVTNLGGFFAGMVLAVFGGCMALAWTDDKPSQRSKGIEA
ncbi:DUF6114 domain-containing protein [Smaragdicoccus niigatensis]|uniref:DUF6114 domain-containing protein n=1 Tax=Smaragdicoccus niigatensis TaxID=359359 RepID=UPI00035E7189|nr:DUF6114 domain-containing protein [Smaragdicoccus niigatensis]